MFLATRSTQQCKADALEKLEKDADVWVATGDENGIAHLVPLPLCWHDGKVIVAVDSCEPGSRNAAAYGQAQGSGPGILA